MSLSVILPNFNHAALIPRALRALVEQVPPATEIIVIDDASTDDSIKIIESFQRRHPSIRLIRHETNRGVTPAVKSGLDVATGKYLLLAASDDFVLPGLIDRSLSALRENPSAAFFCSEVAMLDQHGHIAGFRPFAVPRLTPGFMSPDDVRREIRKTDFWFLGPSVVHRRDLLEAIGYFDETLGSIADTLGYRLLAFRHGFYFDPEVLAAYTKYPESFSGQRAMSISENRRMFDAAQRWMSVQLPDDIRDEHKRLFDRRMRFAMARLWVVWRKGALNTAAIGEILNLGSIDKAIIQAFSHLPVLSPLFVLGWLTVRVRPFGLVATFKAWWRNVWVNRGRRARVEKLVSRALGQTSIGA